MKKIFPIIFLSANFILAVHNIKMSMQNIQYARIHDYNKKLNGKEVIVQGLAEDVLPGKQKEAVIFLLELLSKKGKFYCVRLSNGSLEYIPEDCLSFINFRKSKL